MLWVMGLNVKRSNMKSAHLIIIGIVFCLIQQMRASCAVDDVKLKEAIISFGKQEGYDQFSEELLDLPAFGIKSEWKVFGKTQKGSVCLAGISRVLLTKAEGTNVYHSEEEHGSHYVFGYASNERTITIKRLKDVVVLPEKLLVGIGEDSPFQNQDGTLQPELPQQIYYVELSGESVEDAYASIIMKKPISGLFAKISKERIAASFDPTPNRSWHLEHVTYRLRRGVTIELQDVYAHQLDEDFDAYFTGSRGEIGPWSSFLRRVKINDAWKDVLIWDKENKKLVVYDPL
jgi:hypothetical protein